MDPLSAQLQLVEDAVAEWARADVGVSPDVISTTRQECRAPGALALHDALVTGGHVDLARVAAAFDDPKEIVCPRCAARYRLGAVLARAAAGLSCPICSTELSSVDVAGAEPATALVEREDGERTVVGLVDDDEKTDVRSGQGSHESSQTVAGGVQPGRRMGDFRILSRLGAGGMGEVYLAENEAGEQVALKVLPAKITDETLRTRFEREWKILTQLDHPAIVRALAHGTDETTRRTYIALELAHGGSLADLLAKRPDRRCTVGETLYILERCTQALASAHAAGILHRDVKPSNIVLTKEGEVKLTDFGIALADDVSVRLTAVDEIVGTPHYLAPETALEAKWGPPADFYALGVLGFRLLAGRVPFEHHKASLPILDAQVNETPPSLDAFAPDAPEALAKLIKSLLSKNPLKRPDAHAVLSALGEIRLQPDETNHREGRRPQESLGRDAIGIPPATDLVRTDSTLAEGQSFDKYRIEGELGRGGMGVVYKAFHTGLKKHVAIKVLVPNLLASDEVRKRFLREAESAGALRHPYIVPVIDVGQRGDTYYLTMEFVPGVPLSKHLRSTQDRAALLALFTKICEGVHHAHTHGVIHRDLKPDNVLVAGGDPHVLDFGIAKRIDVEDGAPALTTEGSILGTIRYMPPEQAAGQNQDVDVRSDVYALGTILYEIVTGGQTPFQGTTREILHQIHFAAPRPPSLAKPDVPWELDAICLKALEKQRDDRYQSALELKRDVERYLSGHPIVARRATGWYRLKKWVARNKQKAAAYASVALLMLLLGAALVGTEVKRELDRRHGVLENVRLGWGAFGERRYDEALKRFTTAEAGLKLDESLVATSDIVRAMPPELATELPAEERDRPRVTKERLRDKWLPLAENRIRFQTANASLEAAARALEAGKLDESERAIRGAIALLSTDPTVVALAARVAAAYVKVGESALARLTSRPPGDFESQKTDLEAARSAFTSARQLDSSSEGAVVGRSAVDREEKALDERRGKAERIREAEDQLRVAQKLESDAASLKKAGSVDEAEAKLNDALRAIEGALSFFPELEAARDEKVVLHLRLGELALDRKDEKVEVADEQLKNARVRKDLGPALQAEVAAFEERLARVDQKARAFRAHVERAEKAFGEGDLAGARSEYDLALEARPDDRARRRRDVCQAFIDAAAARDAKDLVAERAALIRARKLGDDPKALEDSISRLSSALYEGTLQEANRLYREAAERHGGWQDAIAAYERALSFREDGAEALRGRADACAERDRPEGMVLVSVPLKLLAKGIAAARTGDDECRRFYIDQDEVTNEAYLRFVNDKGYETERLWTSEGWSGRRALVDQSGKNAPSDWVSGKPRAGTEALPVTGVSFHEAAAFARWRGARLPLEDEWLLAACFDVREKKWRRFPSGEDAATGARARARELRPSGSTALDVSPWGVRDMGWNASEWVAVSDAGQAGGAVRGLSCRALDADVARGVLDWRKTPRAEYRDDALGFRCARDVPAPAGGH